MELKIYSPTEDGFIKEIQWNHEEIKKEVAEKVALYKNLVYTDDQIKEAKADRATLNKFVKALEDKRKEIKTQCLAPYEEFEKQMKEIIGVVNEPIALIDKQIKEADRIRKEEKLKQIKALWESLERPDGLPFDIVYNDKFLNTTYNMKRIEQYMKDAITRFNMDMETLAKLPEFGFEAQQMYLNSFNLNQALAGASRMADIARAKAEKEAREAEAAKRRAEEEERRAAEIAAQKAEREAAQVQAQPVEPEVKVPGTSSNKEVQETTATDTSKVMKQWVSFSALLSVEDATALKEFFESREIEFKAV